MILDRTDTHRASLLARSEVLPSADQYLIQVMKQNYAPIPVITGPRGSGRTAVLHEIGERQGVIGRSVGYGAVKTGLGQALVDCVVSLTGSIASRRPESKALGRLIKAGEEFMRKSPDEGTVAMFGQAVDFLLYSLSNETTEIQGGFVLLLDDLQRANESRLQVLIEGVVALGQTGAPVPFVFAHMRSQPSKPVEGLEDVLLRPLGTGDLADLAERVGLSIDGGGMKVLADFTQGLPGPAVELLASCSGTHRLTADAVREAIAAYELVRKARPPEYGDEFIPPSPSSSGPATEVDSMPVLPPHTVGSRLPAAKAPAPVVSAPVQAAAAPVAAPARVVAPSSVAPAAVAPAPIAPAPVVAPVPVEAPQPMKSVAEHVVRPRLPAKPGLPVDPNVLPTRTPRVASTPAPEVAPVAPPEPVPAPLVAISLTPTQKRCVESMLELSQAGNTVTLALLRRRLGDVSRFGGAATPVASAVKELVALGALIHADDDGLSMTPLGEVSLAAIAK
jgi:hypothetical protein